MNDFVKFVYENKAQIVNELYNWADTFDWELDEEDERTNVSLVAIRNLAKRLDKDLCTTEDYLNIEFHIFQINYNEIIIDMGYPSGIMVHRN